MDTNTNERLFAWILSAEELGYVAGTIPGKGPKCPAFPDKEALRDEEVRMAVNLKNRAWALHYDIAEIGRGVLPRGQQLRRSAPFAMTLAERELVVAGLEHALSEYGDSGDLPDHCVSYDQTHEELVAALRSLCNRLAAAEGAGAPAPQGAEPPGGEWGPRHLAICLLRAEELSLIPHVVYQIYGPPFTVVPNPELEDHEDLLLDNVMDRMRAVERAMLESDETTAVQEREPRRAAPFAMTKAEYRLVTGLYDVVLRQADAWDDDDIDLYIGHGDGPRVTRETLQRLSKRLRAVAWVRPGA